VLAAWLSEAEHQAFCDSRQQRRAHAVPSVASVRSELFDWSAIERVLVACPDVLVVRESELLARPAPRTAHALRDLMALGAGVVVRRAQLQDAAMRELAGIFQREFSRSVQIQLFVTPARTRGFGWHYDAEDVIILQTVGSKTYYFRENTCTSADDADFLAIRREVSPIAACTLAAGDALYLPRGMWHMAKALEDSLSISIGLSAHL
jgi:hypothetical protein